MSDTTATVRCQNCGAAAIVIYCIGHPTTVTLKARCDGCGKATFVDIPKDKTYAEAKEA